MLKVSKESSSSSIGTELQPLVGANKEKEPPLSFKERVRMFIRREKPMVARTIKVNGEETKTEKGSSFPQNVIRNQKYSLITFIPVTLYEQFKSFINFYYLILTLSQFIPVLSVGPVFTYAAPLAFVVGLSIVMEGYLDFKRMKRDREVNGEKYKRLTKSGLKSIKAADIKVGHFIQVESDQRIPADMLLVRTTSEIGASFIRTDQLDGETDWKLRKAVRCTQQLEKDEDLFTMPKSEVYAEKPKKEIYDFIGNFIIKEGGESIESLNLENTLWSSTVLASDVVIGLVLYTGRETRSVLNTSVPETKKGKLDQEINRYTMILCVCQVSLGFLLVCAGLFKGIWWLNLFRFLVLVSAVIPISMSVNLDVSKFVYAGLVYLDNSIPQCIVRNTTIPEELGRISYLLSDKTGTLTQNDMIFRRLNLGTVNFTSESLDDLTTFLRESFEQKEKSGGKNRESELQASKFKNIPRIDTSSKVNDIMCALALCHNVTPVKDNGKLEYQASSPDEVSLVKFTESIGLTLYARTFTSITIQDCFDNLWEYEILDIFPFTSERKRMGIILKNTTTGEIKFLMKGADVIMKKIVQESDWLDEECDNLAREGLRTLVFGQRVMSQEDYEKFADDYQKAKEAISNREEKVNQAIESIEEGLELIGLTGVEDKLQQDIRTSLELLRNAGIKIWMLTGDKRETATCIATSSKLAARNHSFYQMELQDANDARAQLNDFGSRYDTVLVVDGKSLQLLLDEFSEEFYKASKNAPAVVCCRCSPTQKADVVTMIRKYSGAQCAAIGDGGNDVSMIQAANIGIGIVGKEGKQAALAADYSIIQFSHITKLLLWHGRNSYHNSAKMSQFIIHRGCIIAFMQAIYSAIFYMSPVVVFTGLLLFGYSMWYTMAPVFALCINRDVTESAAMLYPELYQELRKGRALTKKTLAVWLLISVYQASAIIFLGVFVTLDYVDFVSVTFTCLCFVELINIAMLITSWHPLITIAEISTFAIYPLVMLALPIYYHMQYISSWLFWTQVFVGVACASIPVFVVKLVYYTIHTPSHKKVN